MTLLYSKPAETALATLARRSWPSDEFQRLVRALILLENDAMAFERDFFPLIIEATDLRPGAGALQTVLIEAEPGAVFVLQYRLVTGSEDVWIETLAHGR